MSVSSSSSSTHSNHQTVIMKHLASKSLGLNQIPYWFEGESACAME